MKNSNMNAKEFQKCSLDGMEMYSLMVFRIAAIKTDIYSDHCQVVLCFSQPLMDSCILL